jgi:hypothetical protein
MLLLNFYFVKSLCERSIENNLSDETNIYVVCVFEGLAEVKVVLTTAQINDAFCK